MYKIFLIILLFTSVVSNAQQKEKDQILQDSQSFIVALETKNYEHFINMMYPKIFDYINKETFLTILKQVYEGNLDYIVEIIEVDNIIFNTSEIFNDVLDTKYAFVTYPLVMKMTFLNQEFKTEEDKEMVRKMMELDGVKIEFLGDNSIKASVHSMTIAIKDSVTNNEWKYLNHDEDNPYRSLFISSTILRNAKDYYYDLIVK